jgi:Mrp family chromosome partitioning ATPase
LPIEPGLTEILSNKVKTDVALQRSRVDDLTFLASGEIADAPAELLGSGRMRELMAQLRTQYEAVVMDSPPILWVSDGLNICAQVDGCILVVRHRITRIEEVLAARNKIIATGGQLAGVILNSVRFRFRPAAVRYAAYSDLRRSAAISEVDRGGGIDDT